MDRFGWGRKDEGGGTPPHRPSFHLGCRHWREPVRVGRYIITCSAHIGMYLLMPPVPDFGIYLAAGWRELLGESWTNGSYLKRLAEQRPYPALVRNWPDGQSIPSRDLDQLVEICLSKMRHHKMIDIGCAGGHGRTGTLLACLIARVEHLSGEEAIRETRSRYCRHAVETLVQERLVREYIENFGIQRVRCRK